jgi:hypothetical protein
MLLVRRFAAQSNVLITLLLALFFLAKKTLRIRATRFVKLLLLRGHNTGAGRPNVV